MKYGCTHVRTHGTPIQKNRFQGGCAAAGSPPPPSVQTKEKEEKEPGSGGEKEKLSGVGRDEGEVILGLVAPEIEGIHVFYRCVNFDTRAAYMAVFVILYSKCSVYGKMLQSRSSHRYKA